MKIDIESHVAKVDRYTPVYMGQPLEPEHGLADNSIRNLNTLLELGLKVASANVVNNGVLVVFTSGVTYLATGLKVGDPQESVEACAKFLSTVFHGSEQEWFNWITAPPFREYRGEIYPDELPCEAHL